MTDLPADPPAGATTAMCECGHHWSVHAASGMTAPGTVCHGYIGTATPGPLREPCRCKGFAPWDGPRDARTGEPVRPLMLTVDARQPPQVPPDRAAGAAVIALRQCLINHGATIPMDVLHEALAAARPHIAAAERAKLHAELGNGHHVIFTPDGWTTEHSVECRLSGRMHECEYHTAVARIAGDYDPGMAGRWRIDGIGSEGLPSLVRADGQPATRGDTR